ncbi:MAG: hypothetical protein ACK5VI_10745 [Opitutia bacterium]|jgi:Tfp pilus assembly protein PilW
MTIDLGSKLQYVMMMDRAYEHTMKLAAYAALSPDELRHVAEAFALRAKAHRRDIRSGAVPYRRPDEEQFTRKSLIPLEVDLAARSWAFRLHLLANAKVGHWMYRTAREHAKGTDPIASALQQVLSAVRSKAIEDETRPELGSVSDAYQWIDGLYDTSPFEMETLTTCNEEADNDA